MQKKIILFLLFFLIISSNVFAIRTDNKAVTKKEFKQLQALTGTGLIDIDLPGISIGQAGNTVQFMNMHIGVEF